ncbi:hypothetical protein HY485_02330 [Candidatus Woesearchaeota archaeon]|nr:hypothetical protein [Candidatus Woesearchaeota archaeon]
MKHLATYTLAAVAELSSGCVATGYQAPRHEPKVIQTLAEREFGESIDEFCAKEIARLSIPVTSTALPEEKDITLQFAAEYSKTTSQINYNLRTGLDEIITQNIVMNLLSEQNRIQRWLVDSAKRNARWNYKSKPLRQNEQEFVEKYLDYLTASVERLDANTRAALKAKEQQRMTENENRLRYVVSLLTAKADIEAVEFNVAEMHHAYQRLAIIKKSIDGIDLYVHGEKVWNNIHERKIGETLYEECRRLDQIYRQLLFSAEEILKQGTYKDKHEVFQNHLYRTFEMPTLLYENNIISANDVLALKAKIVKDIADIFKTNDVKSLPGLDPKIAGLSAIPYVGIFVDVDKWGIAFTKDVFTPETNTPVEQFAEILKEGNRLNSGNGNSQHQIGSTDPAIDECVITVASTAITTVGIIGGVMRAKNNHHQPAAPSATPPNPPTPSVPPVSGGGTIGPGTGN